MEFPFDINHVLPYEVTIFNGDYRVLNQGHSIRVHASEKLTAIIDAIGEASYKAQGLSGAVTTARKFRTSEHRLYLIKKLSDNNHSGSVVGILKVGAKHLYIYDSNGQVHERTPLCVLDFYVHESKQRLGYGKRLFDTMLEFEKCAPYELAIDRPSHKCLAFLHKHYDLSTPLHQVNNFVVYPAFFNRSPITMSRQTSPSKERQEWTSWLLPSQMDQRRPSTEQSESGRNLRSRKDDDSYDIFGNRRITSIDRPRQSPYLTSYGQHYNQVNINGTTHSASYMPRPYSQVFNENNSFAGLHRYNSNPIIPILPPSPTHEYRRTTETIFPISKPEPLTSLYTFPSFIKPSNNWQSQPSPIDSNLSSWRIFGVHQ